MDYTSAACGRKFSSKRFRRRGDDEGTEMKGKVDKDRKPVLCVFSCVHVERLKMIHGVLLLHGFFGLKFMTDDSGSFPYLFF